MSSTKKEIKKETKKETKKERKYKVSETHLSDNEINELDDVAKKYQKKKRKTSTGRRQRTKRAPMKSVNTRSRNKYSKKQRKIKHTRKRHYIKPTHSFTKNDI